MLGSYEPLAISERILCFLIDLVFFLTKNSPIFIFRQVRWDFFRLQSFHFANVNSHSIFHLSSSSFNFFQSPPPPCMTWRNIFSVRAWPVSYRVFPIFQSLGNRRLKNFQGNGTHIRTGSRSTVLAGIPAGRVMSSNMLNENKFYLEKVPNALDGPDY